MKTTIRLELFGSKYLGWNNSEPFIARIFSFNRDTGEFSKDILKGYVDYAKANSVGSRGVYKYYFVDDGFYEINERISWKRVSHYFLLIKDGNRQKMNFEEAVSWLKQHWELPF